MKTAFRRAMSLLLGWAAIGASAAGQEAPPGLSSWARRLHQQKEELHFSSWPGKQGPLKPGVRLVPANLPSLSGFTVSRDDVGVHDEAGSPMLCRTIRMTRGEVVIEIVLRVSQKDTDHAQEALLRQVIQTNAPLELVAIRGDQHGIALGDLNFVHTLDPARLVAVHFSRNNLSVSIRELNNVPANLLEIAKSIDGLIVAEPDLTARMLEAEIPVITQFEPNSKTLALLSSTTVPLRASDPRGRVLQYLFSGTLGQIRVDRSISPPRVMFLSTTQPGLAAIDLLVVNENLLFTRGRAEITIEK